MGTKIVKNCKIDVKNTFEISTTSNSWCIYEKNSSENFGRDVLIFSGHLTYNGKDVVMYLEDKRYYFFEDFFRKN